MLRPRPPRRLRTLSINRLIPNILTVLALCSGLTALRFGLDGRYPAAVLALLFAGVLDGLDGRIARLIGATSKLGAQLDSLSDFVCFGVVPALLLYLWTMHSAGRFGWAAVLVFVVAAALRLARFNSALEDPDRPAWASSFFVGVPTPAGASLALLPMIASFEEIGRGVFDRPWFVAPWLALVGALMVSRLPTYAFKRLRVRPRLVMPVLLTFGALAAGLATEPWLTLLLCGLAYLGTLPWSVRAVRRLEARDSS